jgi:hypothetical protein
MNKLIALSMMVLSLVGCAEAGNLPEIQQADDHLNMSLVIDEDFSDTEIGLIVEAGQAWEDSTKGRVKIAFSIGPAEYGQDWTIAKFDRSKIKTLGTTGVSRKFFGLGTEEIHRSAVWSGYNNYFKLAAVHELGHMMGLNHIDNAHCVMNGGNSDETAALGITVPQDCDMDQFNQLHPIK